MFLFLWWIHVVHAWWIVVDLIYVSTILVLRLGKKSPRDRYEEYAKPIICQHCATNEASIGFRSCQECRDYYTRPEVLRKGLRSS
jgi:hypothetical protein